MNFKKDQTAEKLRGGYYTPPEIASFLLRWALAGNPKSLLEPGCGDGAFIRPLAEMDPRGLQTLLAFEIEPIEAAKARVAARKLIRAEVEVTNGDFLRWTLKNAMRPRRVDAVVGNPPFIRYQYIDPDSQEIAQRLFQHLGLPFTKHTNSWVSFVAASLSLLNPGGRLAMVVPSEILHILHAQGLRTFLTQSCARVLVIDPTELWFAGALQGAVLILAEKKQSPSDIAHGVAITRVSRSDYLKRDPQELFRKASFSDGDTLTGKWMPALLTKRQRDLLRDAADRPDIYRFESIASVDVGIVTGANKFFLVSDAVVEQFGLHEWAHPMFGRSDHVPGVIYSAAVHRQNRKDGLPTNFLWFGDTPRSRFPASVVRYLKLGEEQNLESRYKCRIREPWYSVPSVYSTPLGMLKRSHNFPRLILNEIGAFTTDTAYRVRAEHRAPLDLVFSFVNSLTAVSAELEGRHYGGGVLELVPSEIESLLVPIVKTTAAALRDLDQRVRNSSSAEELLGHQDKLVLRRLGMSAPDITEIQEIWTNLRGRRQRHVENTEDAA